MQCKFLNIINIECMRAISDNLAHELYDYVNSVRICSRSQLVCKTPSVCMSLVHD